MLRLSVMVPSLACMQQTGRCFRLVPTDVTRSCAATAGELVGLVEIKSPFLPFQLCGNGDEFEFKTAERPPQMIGRHMKAGYFAQVRFYCRNEPQQPVKINER